MSVISNVTDGGPVHNVNAITNSSDGQLCFAGPVTIPWLLGAHEFTMVEYHHSEHYPYLVSTKFHLASRWVPTAQEYGQFLSRQAIKQQWTWAREEGTLARQLVQQQREAGPQECSDR